MVTVPLAMDYGLRGALSVSGGWIARGERLLADEPEGVEHGHLALVRGANLIDMASLERAAESFQRAELAVRHGDRSLETTALVFEGAIRVWTGDVEAGIAILDEATAAATSGARPARHRDRLLRHDRFLPGAGRLRRFRVDRGRQPLVRSPRRHRLSRGVPRPPGSDPPAPRRLAEGGGAGDPGLQELRLQPLGDRGRVLRDR